MRVAVARFATESTAHDRVQILVHTANSIDCKLSSRKPADATPAGPRRAANTRPRTIARCATSATRTGRLKSKPKRKVNMTEERLLQIIRE